MIFTFYSYKGGVGRSMALVNIASLLRKAGFKVIMVDWDLEAPGLERFYPASVNRLLNNPGVIDMLLAYKHTASHYNPASKKPLFPVVNTEDFLVDIYNDNKLFLLPAGNRSHDQFADYVNKVKTFDWDDFYENWEGEVFFEWLRNQFSDFADFVLIDSRTGVTEMGGVCTYQLADVIVMFCAANTQNIHGTLQMIKSFSDPRLPELRHGRDLKTLVVPSRVERTTELESLNDFRREFKKCFFSNFPDELKTDPDFFMDLETPYIPAYAFEEIIAVDQAETSLRSVEMEEAYTNLLKVLSDLALGQPGMKEKLAGKNSESYIKGLISAASETPEPDMPMIDYVNAKVVLIGDSGVGKSGLAIRIAQNKFHTTDSTHGAQFWQIQVPGSFLARIEDTENLTMEISLWDLAGQTDYRLIHQLFLDDIDAVLLLFDCSDPADPFRGVPYWAKLLKKRAPDHVIKFLVSSRCDVTPLTVDEHQIERIMSEYHLDKYFRTSAKTGAGVDELVQHLFESIPWEILPRTSVPRLFKVIQDFLVTLKATGKILLFIDEIRNEIRHLYTKQKDIQEEIEQKDIRLEIDAAIKLLQAKGLVFRLDFTARTDMILLRPELINQYASAMIQAARNHPKGIGAVSERDILVGKFPISNFNRLDPNEEKVVLESTLELLIRQDLCFREMGFLVFPSQINVNRPESETEHPPSSVIYEFSGSIEAIYASLVVRLSYTQYFCKEDQWKYVAEFSREGHRLGFVMNQIKEGTGELEIYFHSGINDFDRVTFIRFITDHLRTKGIDIEEKIRLYCPNPKCSKEIKDQNAIETRVQSGKLDIHCQYCGTSVIIPRTIEDLYTTDNAYIKKQRQLTLAVEQAKQEVRDFRADNYGEAKKETNKLIHILHLSDFHINTSKEAVVYRTQLETDLRRELMITDLDYLVISGDIANRSTPEEYKAALDLIDGIAKSFRLDPNRLIIVPGNHDLNWNLSKNSYVFVFKDDLKVALTEDLCIPVSNEVGVLLRDENRYKQRFAHFSDFYKKIFVGVPYPLNYAEQGILYLCPEDEILFLGLNSCWEVDHFYRQRTSINMEAMYNALDRLHWGEFDEWLKIAVWHHPVSGPGMMNNADFLQQLAVQGFQLCMHGHIHERKENFYQYDSVSGICLIGAGTFGAPADEQAIGVPLQYNLLKLDAEHRNITVETRKKEKPDGAWSGDSRWGDKNNPQPRYIVELKNNKFT